MLFEGADWESLLRLFSGECQKPEPPLLLKKVSQYTSSLYCGTPPICIAMFLVPLRSAEREILSVLSVLLPFVSQYTAHLHCSTPPICIAALLGRSWWLWSPRIFPILWLKLGDGPLQRLEPHFKFETLTLLHNKMILPTVRGWFGSHYGFAVLKSPCGGGLAKTKLVTFQVPSGAFFLCLWDWQPRKTSSFEPETSHYVRFGAQNARKQLHDTFRKVLRICFYA